jgi:hypothetical protein
VESGPASPWVNLGCLYLVDVGYAFNKVMSCMSVVVGWITQWHWLWPTLNLMLNTKLCEMLWRSCSPKFIMFAYMYWELWQF